MGLPVGASSLEIDKTNLGGFAGTSTSMSDAYGMSADGSVVIGTARLTDEPYNYSSEAFRWTAGGKEKLGTLGSSWLISVAKGVSSDGSVVVGYSLDNSMRNRAFRWDSNSGMQDLGTLDGHDEAIANAVSGDGKTIVGMSGSLAFRWNESDGVMKSLGVLNAAAPYSSSGANGVSGDGEVIVGQSTGFSHDSNGYFYNRAFLWTESAGMQDLGTLRTDNEGASSAMAVSNDGTTVVGASHTDSDNVHAYRWREGAGMRLRGRYPTLAHLPMTWAAPAI